ncbi:MAG: hypothetical protein HKM07_04440 [Chlamydiae bacterium]|nr:hypothetical protein [Chlamydiota bacterium]
MTDDPFLALLNPIAGKKKSRVVVQGSVIFIETSPKKRNKWNTSTKFAAIEGPIPTSSRGCLASYGILPSNERGFYLKVDEVGCNVYFTPEIESSAKYVPFKYLGSDFAEVAEEWKTILDDFSEREYSPLSLGN